MRELATAANREQAGILVDYLLTQNIPAEARLEDGQEVIWVRDEDDLERAREIWAEFRTDPHNSKYVASRKPAKVIRKKNEEAEKKYASLYQDASDFWGRPAPARVPLTCGIIIVSIVLTAWSQFGQDPEVFYRFTFADPPRRVVIQNNVDPEEMLASLVPGRTALLRQGEYWRLITPIFVHLGVIHLLFGMYSLYTLAALVEFRRGPWWLLLFVLVTGVLTNCVQYLLPTAFELDSRMRLAAGSPYFGGMSGVSYALFGYLVAKTVYAPEPGLRIPRDTIWILITWFFLCMTGYFGPVGNTAHAVGLASGLMIGAAPKLWRQLTAER
jgi:GlpG protein